MLGMYEFSSDCKFHDYIEKRFFFKKNNKPLYAPCFLYAGKFLHILIQWTYVTAQNIKIGFLIRIQFLSFK